MFKVLSFLARRPGTDAASFRDYYENHHVPLIYFAYVVEEHVTSAVE